MKYYIGVDGGGTKTQYALFDENKNMILSVKTTGSNHENIEGGIPEAASIIMGGINDLLTQAGKIPADIEKSLMALAGIDHPWQEKAMREELTKLGLTIPVAIYNDGFIIVKAGLTGKAGIGYNCGTGTCCNSIDNDGNLLQIGGFNYLCGDVGGGHWIASQTFRALYDDICLKIRKTAMTAEFVKRLGIEENRDGLLSLVGDLEEENDDVIRVMLDIFFDCANAGDDAAMDIIHTMAKRGAEYICGHLNQQNFTDDVVEVVLSGSIHVKLPSSLYTQEMEALAQEMSGRKLKFIKLTDAPVTGCINWMLED